MVSTLGHSFNAQSNQITSYTAAGGVVNQLEITMTYPNGRVLHYGYDGNSLDNAVGRLSYLADDNGSGGTGSHIEDYQYLGLSTPVSQAGGNGVALSYVKQAGDASANADGGDPYTGLDRFGRVIDQNYVNTATGVSTDRYQYGYDRNSNALYKNNLVNPSQSELYHANSSASGDNNTAYDPLGRLTGFRRGTLSSSANNGAGLDAVGTSTSAQSWNLDALGNWTSQTVNGTATSRSTNSQNELTQVGSNSLSYDNNGNTLVDEQGRHLVYDAWNRLMAVKDGTNTNTLASYAYDGSGRRVTETYPAGPVTNHLYYSAGWQVVEERQGGTASTNLAYQYVWSPFYVDAMVLRDAFAGGVFAQRLYAQQDADYNTTALADSSGHVVERYLYDPYGNVTVTDANYTPAANNASSYAWRYLFQGKRRDFSTGLDDSRNRAYSPTLGRWMQRDPAGYLDGGNAYQYETSQPTCSLVVPRRI